MNKILIDPHHCSREEYKELTKYLSKKSWDFKELETNPLPENFEKVTESLAVLVGTIEDIIQRMPQKGDSASECQRMCMQQAISEFYYTVNGLEKKDLKP